MKKSKTTKIAGFLKRLEDATKNDEGTQKPEKTKSIQLSHSNSNLKLRVRNPSERALMALGIFNLGELSPKRSAVKTFVKSSSPKVNTRKQMSLIRKDTSDSSIKELLKESISQPHYTDRYPKKTIPEFEGSQTERTMSVVNNFNLKFNQQSNDPEKYHFEVTDLKLKLQMKKIEVSSLSQEVKSLKNSVKRLEQDNLRLRQSLDDISYQQDKTQQKCDYYKSLVELKNAEISGLDTKFKGLQRQVKSQLNNQPGKKSLANWGNSMVQAVSGVSITKTDKINRGLPLEDLGIHLSDIQIQALNRTFYSLYEAKYCISSQQVQSALDVIPSTAAVLAANSDIPNLLGKDGIFNLDLQKISILLTIIFKTIREDFELKREVHRSLASVHQHYVNKLNSRQQEYRDNMDIAEDLIAQYESRLADQSSSRVEATRRTSAVSNDAELLDNYIDDEEFDRLQSHQLDSVSLIYHSSESHK